MAAVDVDDLTGDPTRGVAQQKHRHVGDIGDLTDPGQWGALSVVLADLWGIDDHLDEVGADQAGPNSVDAHPRWAEFVGGQHHEMVQRGLRDAVGAEPAVYVAGRDRRDPDEGSPAGPDHLARGVLEDIHGAVDVEVDGAPPGLGVDLGDRADGLRTARAVHDAVQPAVPRGDRLDHPGHLLLVGHVGGLEPDSTGRIGGDLGGGGREAVAAAADDHHVGAGTGQALGHTLADSAATPGHQVGPVGEIKLHGGRPRGRSRPGLRRKAPGAVRPPSH